VENLIDVYLRSVRDKEDKGEAIAKCLQKAETRYQHLKPLYRLWWGYLSKSERYSEVCEWFLKGKPEYLKKLKPLKHMDHIGLQREVNAFLLNYLFFTKRKDRNSLGNYCKENLRKNRKGFEEYSIELLVTFPFLRKLDPDRQQDLSFFSWALKSEFPYSSEMLMNYFIFGDIHNHPFDDYWNRALFMLETREKVTKASVGSLFDVVDELFEEAELEANKNEEKKPKLIKIKDSLREILKGDHNRMFLYVSNPDQDDSSVPKQIKDLMKVGKFRRKLETKGKVVQPDDVQFEYPTMIGRINELQRYLKAYELKKEGLTNIEIYKEIYPIKSKSHVDPIRLAQRDCEKARKIIKNVENGYFPGQYS